MHKKTDYTIIGMEFLNEKNTNENPDTVIMVRHNKTTKIGYVAGPHGVDSCALSDWLANVGEPAKTRGDAMLIGCDYEWTE